MIAHKAITYRPIRQLRRTKGLHKLLHHRLFVPLEIVDRAINRIKFVWNPAQVRERTRLAATLQPTEADAFLQRHGYLHVAPEQLDGLQTIVADCTRIYGQSVETGSIQSAQMAAVKDFLISVVKDEQMLDHPSLLDFAVSRPLVELASKYFGSVPMLSGVRLWWTPPNSTTTDSQLFHCDREDRRQLKFLIGITEATTDTGPFTLIPADESARIKSAVNYNYHTYRLTDDDISRVGQPSEIISLTGPPGSVTCVDTSRCLHYGSRNNTSPRLLLMIQFTDCLAPNVTIPQWHRGLSDLDLDELQRLALGVSAG